MGCSTNVVCLTCRKDYYCGYGPYSTYGERARRFPKQEHAGHEVRDYCDELMVMEGDDLMLEGQHENELYIEGLRLFERIDVSQPPVHFPDEPAPKES